VNNSPAEASSSAVPRYWGTDPTLGFSAASSFGSLVFVSGQVAWGIDHEVVGGDDPRAQAVQAFRNLERVLREAGSDLDHVLKITVLMTDPGMVPIVRSVRNDVFAGRRGPPASTFAVVAGLASPDLLVEVEAIATTRVLEAGGE
jgi:enamine deaminase RidA (YjgF/YER057c/UK114 family)